MFIKRTAALALVLGLSANADEATDKQLQELKDIVAKQQAQLEAMNKQIKEQEASSKEAIAQYVKTEVDNAMKKQSSLLVLGKHVSSLKFSGDLRLRYQHEDFKDDTAFTQKDTGIKGKEISRDRFRQRLRIGMNWESKDEHWEVGARLATGDSNGRSTNDTYGDEGGGAYEHGDIRVDLAYAKMKFSTKEDDFVSYLTMGQQPNPFKTSWIFMDTDLNPIGVSYQYDKLLSGSSEMKPEEREAWFNNVGVYTVDHRNNGWERNDILALQAQTGYRNDQFLVAAGLSHFSANAADQNLNGFEDGGDIVDSDYNYDIAEIYGEVYVLGDGSKAGKKRSLKLVGNFASNLGASSDESQIHTSSTSATPERAGQGDEIAYFVSADGKYDSWNSSIGWAHVEQDSLPKFMVDADFANGQPGYEGLFLKLGYDFTANLSLSGTALFAETIEENPSQRDRHDLYQLDLIWKF
ncbi:MAG: hypothetical protein RL095_2997 [Verrucomicrobiota bacterium]|jgi:hypothetical protein